MDTTTVRALQDRGWLLVEDGNHGEYRPLPNEFGAGDTLFIRAADLNNGSVLFESAERINAAARQRIRKGIGAPRDILLTHKGTVGKLALVGETAPPFVCSPQTTFWRSLDSNKIDQRYLFCFLRSPGFREQLESRKDETDMAPYVSLTAQRQLKVDLPPINEQRAIARVLGALDDKIELNRRLNRSLEELAQAVFRSWFVDFDPVTAKASGRAPIGLDPATAALFPDHFQDSELGEIPKGWRVGTLDSLTEFVLGGDWGNELPTEEFPAAAHCIRGADIPSLQKFDLGKMPIRFLKKSSHEKRSLRDGDIVIEISGGSPTQSTGRPVLVMKALLERLPHPLICSNFCRLVRLKTEGAPRYVYFLMRRLYDDDVFLQFENGTTGIKNFAFTLFSERHPILIPSEQVMAAFDSVVTPLISKCSRNGVASATLAATRDALLPPLLSGELRIKDAEKFLEDTL